MSQSYYWQIQTSPHERFTNEKEEGIQILPIGIATIHKKLMKNIKTCKKNKIKSIYWSRYIYDPENDTCKGSTGGRQLWFSLKVDY